MALPAHRSWNIWAIALIASVLLNGILIGAIAMKQSLDKSASQHMRPAASGFQTGGPEGSRLQGRRGGIAGRPLQSAGSLENLPRYLSREQRRVFNEKARNDGRVKTRTALEALKSARLELSDILAAETIDWESVAQKMAIIRGHRDTLAIIGDEAVLSYLKTLPDTEREALLEALKAAPPRRPKRQR